MSPPPGYSPKLKPRRKHLERAGWLIPIFVLVFVSAFSKTNTISILSVKVKRENAVLFTDAIVAFYAFSFLIVINRLRALFQQLSCDGATTAFTQIATHKWLLNPFAFFGEERWLLNFISVFAISFFYVICNDVGSFLRPLEFFDKEVDNTTFSQKIDIVISLFNFVMGVVIAIVMNAFYRLMSEKVCNSVLSDRIVHASNWWIGVVLISVLSALFFDYAIFKILADAASSKRDEKLSGKIRQRLQHSTRRRTIARKKKTDTIER